MIPLRDENPTRKTPYVVYFILSLNILAYIYASYVRYQTGQMLTGYELVPAEVFRGVDVLPPTPIPAWMTIFTSMFLHANLLHIGSNMLYLWIFGNNIEDVLGHYKFLAFYLVAGVAAALTQILPRQDAVIPMLGASGAVAGVLGAYIVLFPRARIVTLLLLFPFIQVIALSASIVLGFWIALQVLNSMIVSAAGVQGGGVAYGAHIGGFAAGLVMILLLGGRRLLQGRRPVEYHRRSGWRF